MQNRKVCDDKLFSLPHLRATNHGSFDNIMSDMCIKINVAEGSPASEIIIIIIYSLKCNYYRYGMLTMPFLIWSS